MKKLNKFLQDNLALLIVIGVGLLCGLFMMLGTVSNEGFITLDGKDSVITDTTKEWIKDANEALAGMYVKQDSGESNEQLPQMGAFPYYKVDVSSPTAFFNAVNGKGFNEGWGNQCVAGFKEFMYSLSGKVISTSTGGASGYAGQQAQIEPLGFTWHAGKSGLQDGDWGIFGGGPYGHVAMYYNGKWFGQNQGAKDPNAGNAFNLLAIGEANLIGYYRPNIYNKKEPVPTPEPTKPADEEPVADVDTYTVVKGDTLGGITRTLHWCDGCKLYGNDGYTQKLADKNNITNRGLIYPGQIIERY